MQRWISKEYNSFENMDLPALKQTKSERGIFKRIVDSFFDIVLLLLKSKTTVVQLGRLVSTRCVYKHMRVHKSSRCHQQQPKCYLLLDFILLRQSQHTHIIAISYILVIAVLLIYVYYIIKHPQYHLESIVELLRTLLMLSNTILFLPFFESFISIFRCNNSYHYLVRDLQCFSTEHIIQQIIAALGLIAFILLNLVVSLLYNETQPVKEDALSRLDSNFEIIMLFYRILLGILTQFCIEGYCSWILITVSVISSFYFLYQYFKFMPYYNQFVSIFFGSFVGIYSWVAVNAVLSQFYTINGNIIVIVLGAPIIVFLVKYLRENKIEKLITNVSEKMNSDVDALNQITTIQAWIRDLGKSSNLSKELRIKGLINLHLVECINEECVCSNIEELYDTQSDKYLTESNEADLHRNQVFVNHFIKQLYSESLNKFINSPSIHISFAFYQFETMKNVHAALLELKIAAKKRPTIQQQFTIFRYQNIIENYIQAEAVKMKHIYEQLTKVKEFERLFHELQKQIEKVCNLQVEFWTQLTTVVPDLNILNDVNNKIYTSSAEADKLWNELAQINPTYPQALNIYGEYLTYIRNNSQAGKEYFDKAHNIDFAQKSVQDHIKRSDVLFTEDSTVIHISGNKESSGRILKVSQGLFKCFAYSKQEVIGHNVNFLMPTLLAEKHQDYLDIFYKTGRQIMFNKERQLFALNRSGYCFTMKILIKMMPTLAEEIQYVGMIRPVSTDYEYIITDIAGNIDCFTSGAGSILTLGPQLFKDNRNINIQIIAPELVSIFEYRRYVNKEEVQKHENEVYLRNQFRRNSFNNTFTYGQSKFISNNKFSIPGGDALTFYVPQNFAQIIKSEKPTKQTKSNANKRRINDESTSIQAGIVPSQTANKVMRSAPFREFMKYLSKGRAYAKKAPDLKKILGCKEYKECDVRKSMNVEIREWNIPLGNNEERGLKMLLFMISKKNQEQMQQDLKSFDGPNQAQDPQPDHVQNQSPAQAPGERKQVSMIDVTSKNTLVKRMSQGNIQNFFEERSPKSQQIAPLPQNTKPKFEPSKFQQPFMGKTNNLAQRAQYANNNKIMSFLDSEPGMGTQNNVESLSPIREENQESQSPEKKGKGKVHPQTEVKGKNEIKLIKTPQDAEFLDDQMNDALFEHQETVSEVDSKEDQIETDRIDVKQDIALNDEIKQNTKSFHEQESSVGKKLLQSQRSPQSSRIKSQADSILNQNSFTTSKEDSKHQTKNKPEVNKVFSKDKISDVEEDDGEDAEDYEDDEDGEFDDEDDEDEEDDEFFNQENRSDEELMKKSPKADMSSGGRRMPVMKVSSKKQLEWAAVNQEQMIAQNQPIVEKKQKMHDYTRIVTNPRYKFFDDETCGSALFNDCNVSEKELDIRDMIKKNQATKKRREKRHKQRKEEEEKKHQSQVNEEQKVLESEVGEPTMLKSKTMKVRKMRKKGEEQSDSKSKSKSRRSGESSGGVSEEEKKEATDEAKYDPVQEDYEHDERGQQQGNDEGEVSSVASSLQSQARTFFSLRAAIDEKFIPRSILNLSLVANLIWTIVILLAIVYYVIQVTLFSQIQSYVQIIINSEERVNDIMTLNLRLNDISLINEGYTTKLDQGLPDNSELIDVYIQNLVSSATDLKNYQTDLSQQTSGLSEESRLQINPEDVYLNYTPVQGIPSAYSFNIWEAIFEIVVAAYRIAENPNQITHSNTQAQFIQTNCMNSVMSALQQSTQAIINVSDDERQSNIQVFMFLLISVSCSLVLSMGFLIPVIRRAKKNKQKVFELFTHRKIEKAIDDQLKKCRWFIQKYQASNENQMFENEAAALDNMIEENTHIPEKEMKHEDDKQSEYMKNYKKQKRKWKRIDSEFGMMFFKFMIVATIIEAFFLFSYFISRQFLDQVSQLSFELQLLISRQPDLTNLILMEKELFYYNGNVSFLNQPVSEVITNSFANQQSEYQELLQVFTDNYDYHTQEYNNDFNNIIFSDLCQAITFTDFYDSNLTITQDQCSQFDGGILQKGVFNAVVKFWVQLSQLYNDFQGSNITQSQIASFLNNEKLITNEIMSNQYLQQSHWYLVTVLQNDINTFFDNQYLINQAAFIVFILFILFMYIFVWRGFLKNLIEEIWKAKSVLSVLPVEVCFRIEEIRGFIYKNSSTLAGATN